MGTIEYPDVIYPSMVGKWDTICRQGYDGYDGVLEYRVWIKDNAPGDAYLQAYETYDEAMEKISELKRDPSVQYAHFAILVYQDFVFDVGKKAVKTKFAGWSCEITMDKLDKYLEADMDSIDRLALYRSEGKKIINDHVDLNITLLCEEHGKSHDHGVKT